MLSALKAPVSNNSGNRAKITFVRDRRKAWLKQEFHRLPAPFKAE